MTLHPWRKPAAHALGGRWSRWILSGGTVLYCSALLYGTLYPFDFKLRSTAGAASSRSRIEWMPFTYVCPKHGIWCPRDRGLNLAIFVPVGALLAARQRGRGTKPIRVATAMGFALSLAIETVQCFLPSRFPSTTDLLANTAGTWLGAKLLVVLCQGRRGERLSRP